MILKMTLLSIALTYYQPGFADVTQPGGRQELQSIQKEWARLNYMKDFRNTNYRELQALAKRANHFSHDFPDSAEALAWDAIVLSTLANRKGGIGALSLVNEAKLKLEKAEKINGKALDGSIYASLGTLYSKVPGWPIGFGNDKTARRYFEKALAVNPNSLENNYFFAEFLADNDQLDEALKHIDKALNAPVMTSRPLADEGRRQQAASLRQKLIEDKAS
jgi:tetratricopeptide (TPR) repeat protein